MEHEAERWIVIADLPAFEVSSRGRVRRVASCHKYPAGMVLQPRTDHNGYLSLTLGFGGKRYYRAIHRLVCRAFHGPPRPEQTDVAHFDGDKTNNCAENLRWATRSENELDKIRHGRAAGIFDAVICTEDDVRAMRQLFRDGRARAEIAQQYGIRRKYLCEILRGEVWKHVA